VPDNDNKVPATLLDDHRGMASQKATEERRHLSEIEADQEALRQSQAELEKFLFATSATDWPEAAEKALYLLRLFAATPEAQDPRRKKMIENLSADLRRLAANISGSRD
jgi:hypothetical protein